MSLADCPICWETHCEHQCPSAYRSIPVVELIIVGNDDWWGLYQDGRLIHEGHDSPNNRLFSEVLKASRVGVEIRTADHDWMCDEMGGRLPNNLKDVKYGKSL